MSNKFNADFYITTATVIPILYIALFLERRLIQDLAKSVGRSSAVSLKTVVDIVRRSTKRGFLSVSLLKIFRPVLMAEILGVAAYVIVVVTFAGIVAEGYSLWALCYQSDNEVMRLVVLWSTLGLVALLCARPTISVIENLYIIPVDELNQEESDVPD